MLPNFIIVGAPKAGTTSLCNYLSEHDEIFMSTPKELNFFSHNEIIKQNLYYKDFYVACLEEYESHFDKAVKKKAVGEGSVSYLFYPQTPIKIHKIIPDVKIIIMLRDPSERAISHYLMDVKLGLVKKCLKQIYLEKDNNNLYYQQYIKLGLYAEQVKRYIDVFGNSKVKIILQEDLASMGSQILREIYRFIDDDYIGV